MQSSIEWLHYKGRGPKVHSRGSCQDALGERGRETRAGGKEGRQLMGMDLGHRQEGCKEYS